MTISHEFWLNLHDTKGNSQFIITFFLCQCHHIVFLMWICDAALYNSTNNQKVYTVILISLFTRLGVFVFAPIATGLNVSRMDACLFYYMYGLDKVRNWN